jgi:uncharacterized protein YqgC (DUF456 family)
MIWLYYTLLILLQLTGLVLTLVGLPGLWLMVGAIAFYGWWTGFDLYIGWPALISMFLLATAAEIVEFLAGAAGSKVAGGTKRSMAGALAGGLVGAIAGSVLLPIPIVGTIAGMCIGSFGGAFLIEWWIKKELGHSANVGWGAAKGRFWGTVLKLVFGAVMFIVAAITALPL